MAMEFLKTNTMEKARKLCAETAKIIRVKGGFVAFDYTSEYKDWIANPANAKTVIGANIDG